MSFTIVLSHLNSGCFNSNARYVQKQDGKHINYTYTVIHKQSVTNLSDQVLWQLYPTVLVVVHGANDRFLKKILSCLNAQRPSINCPLK